MEVSGGRAGEWACASKSRSAALNHLRRLTLLSISSPYLLFGLQPSWPKRLTTKRLPAPSP